MCTNNTNIDTLHLNGATYTILCINLSSSSTNLRSKVCNVCSKFERPKNIENLEFILIANVFKSEN